ncbi:MAG: pyrimidine-nucleoside phosphorylase [Candidatus Infernicultor aquiphilus]|uniref:thymidine phosphorylase n=1 Tax=Candidatus Infernicultor aquiphilus TaxID=1805029 RepID=A0A2M7K9C3_9BACT|nr:MAG: pyrimidine-nucleoside phosphorylase [Candidatus Atribacteria bacterium CG08_land_8_20_14_0_20_33_29]PIX34735.1 MAG: pyrimidine-nucleoside phosphorylase [Candidatus Atribacteria bacterium CG_4_8_14_3_um_filter_34_18]
MRFSDLIIKKRNGLKLTENDIIFMIEEYNGGKIPDYQMSAMLMAIYFKGMNNSEIRYLTKAMIDSGKIIDLSSIPGIKVDKHSTGGVGDTTTLALAPMVAAAGVKVAKMSGRGLGHTGGTIDKLESIEGFKTELSLNKFIKIVKKVGVSIISSTSDLVPADKKLYALRDVTGTVDSIPLIVSSIMSKKLAAGADAIVLDITTGSGAFMREYKDALKLGKIMVDIGLEFKKEIIGVVSNMDEPLGFAIGNSLEVKEAIEILKDKGPEDLRRLCLVLGSYMLKLGRVTKTYQEGKNKLEKILKSGVALNKFKEMIIAQGGNSGIIDNPELLPLAKHCTKIKANKSGYIQKIDSRLVGESAMLLGAGREEKESKIDLSVGIVLKKKVGNRININEDLAEVHYNDSEKLKEAKKKLLSSFIIGIKKPVKLPLILATISRQGIKEFR